MDGLAAAARENPLAAALIGGGALWLLMGNDRLKSAADSVAEPLADLGVRTRRGAASKFDENCSSVRDRASRFQSDVARGTSETVRNATTAASEALSGAAETVGERFEEGIAGARKLFSGLDQTVPGKEALKRAQSSLSDLLEKQPLVLGAVGLAIGATVAGALAKSSLEDALVGDLSDGLKADLKERVGAVSQSVREASDTLKAEFADAGAEYADRIQQAGQDALDAGREKLRQ